MKTFFFLLLLLACTPAFAQTKLVAHRSHGGSNATFTAREAGNFGEYEHRPVLRKVVKLSDTTAEEVYDFTRDTTVRHPYWNNPRIRVDSLRKLFPDISFEGYESTGVTAELRSTSGEGMLPLGILSAGVSLMIAGGIVRRRRA